MITADESIDALADVCSAWPALLPPSRMRVSEGAAQNLVIKRPGMDVSREELLHYFDGKIARFWMPDDVVFIDALPMGATGKIQKNKLREQFKEHKLPSA